jgi:hypothetical protein
MILAYGVHSKTVGKANKRQSTTFASTWVQPRFLWDPLNVTDNLIGNQDNPDTQAALDIRLRTKTNKTKTTTHKTKKILPGHLSSPRFLVRFVLLVLYLSVYVL